MLQFPNDFYIRFTVIKIILRSTLKETLNIVEPNKEERQNIKYDTYNCTYVCYMNVKLKLYRDGKYLQKRMIKAKPPDTGQCMMRKQSGARWSTMFVVSGEQYFFIE